MITYSYLIILKHISGIRISIMYQILKLREPKDEYPHFQNSKIVISFRVFFQYRVYPPLIRIYASKRRLIDKARFWRAAWGMAARSAWMIWSSLALVAGRGLLDLTRLPRTFQRFSMKLTARVDFESSENVTLLQYWRAQARRRVMLMAYRTRQKAGLRDLKPPSRSSASKYCSWC